MGMTGELTVQAAGSAYPETQQQIDAAAQTAIQADAAEAAKSDADAQKVATRPGPNGSTIYGMNIGYTAMNMVADWMRFSQRDITIHQGDSIEWTQQAMMAPHTVTFVSGGKEPDFIQPEAQTAGPPKLVINPQVALPAGGDTYSGSGYFNSGIIEGTMNPAPGPRTYTLTFAQPGRYEYICVIHDQEGMSGYVTVLASQAGGSQPGMPNTGNSARENADGGWALIAGTVALLAGLFLLALWLRQRSSATGR
jgi:plastocyanin